MSEDSEERDGMGMELFNQILPKLVVIFLAYPPLLLRLPPAHLILKQNQPVNAWGKRCIAGAGYLFGASWLPLQSNRLLANLQNQTSL